MLSSVSGSLATESARQYVLSNTGLTESTSEGRPAPPPPGGPPHGGPGGSIEDRITEGLKELGVDEETISSIQEEIETALAEIEESDGSPKDVKETIDGILESHGVDAEAVAESIGPPPGPPPSDSYQGYDNTSTDASETLLNALLFFDEEA